MRIMDSSPTKVASRINIVTILIASGAMAVQAAFASVPPSVPTIASMELRRLMLARELNLIVVDVRAPDAFSTGHIQGARNIQSGSIASAGLPLTAHIVVYCSEPTCALSENAVKNLISAGYKKADLLQGGFGDWLKKGYPSTTGHETRTTIAHRSMEHGRNLRKRLADGTEFALDVRPSKEFKAGHVAGAYNAPLDELTSHYIDLPKGKKIVVYDRIPNRAKQAIAKLTMDGFDAEELSGGLAGWTRRGNNLVTK